MEPSSSEYKESCFEPPSLNLRLHSDDPLDLDSYLGPCKGRKKIRRLIFIAHNCRDLAEAAAQAAITEVKQETYDVNLYETLVNFLKELGTNVEVDEQWIKDTQLLAKNQQDKLEVELKNYQNNVIKESIRLGYNELGNHFFKTGDMENAINSYTKSRDFCATAQQVLETCIPVIDVALDIKNFTLAKNWILKAETSLDSLQSTQAKESKAKGKNTTHHPGMAHQPSSPTPQERELSAVRERLTVASGIAELGLKNYFKASRQLLRVTSVVVTRGSDSGGHFIPADEIVACAVLCALATQDRKQLRSILLENNEFRGLLELQSHLREIILAFFESRYQSALQLLARYQNRHLLSLHLSAHIPNLMSRIESRSIVQFFSPFTAISLERFADAFGYPNDKMEEYILQLIENGTLDARLNVRRKIVEKHAPEQRSSMISKVVEQGQRDNEFSKDILLRLSLIANNMVLRSPEASGSGLPMGASGRRRYR